MEDKAYIGRTDEELIERYKAGDTQAIDALIVRYKKLVKKNARALYLIGGEHDDLIQEGMIGLYKAVRNYDSQKNASFQPFANLCISRQIYTAIQSSRTRKNQPLNDYVSFDAADNEDGELPGVFLYGEHTFESGRNPEELMISQENDKQMEEFLSKKLSRFEMEVLHVYLEEENYAKVAKQLGKSPKTVDNALQRIRKKLMEE